MRRSSSSSLSNQVAPNPFFIIDYEVEATAEKLLFFEPEEAPSDKKHTKIDQEVYQEPPEVIEPPADSPFRPKKLRKRKGAKKNKFDPNEFSWEKNITSGPGKVEDEEKVDNGVDGEVDLLGNFEENELQADNGAIDDIENYVLSLREIQQIETEKVVEELVSMCFWLIFCLGCNKIFDEFWATDGDNRLKTISGMKFGKETQENEEVYRFNFGDSAVKT